MHDKIKKMVHSESHIDKRFIKLFKVRQATQKVQNFNHLLEKNRTKVKESNIEKIVNKNRVRRLSGRVVQPFASLCD